MEGTSSNTQNATRLRQLAESRHAIITESLPALSKPVAPSVQFSDADKNAAIQVIQIQSLATGKKSNESDFNYKEIHLGLRDVVSQQGDQRVVAALIAMLQAKGGDVNIAREVSRNLWKKINGRNQSIERSNLLRTATNLANHGLVVVIAPHADRQSLKESLPIALAHGDLNITETLLRYGADATSSACQSAFKLFAEQNNHDMVSLLLRSPKRPPITCISESLGIAAQQGALDTVKLLVKFGADCRLQDSATLKDSVTGRRDDVALAILAGATRENLPSRAHLDQIMALTSSEQMLLREAILCTGAQGACVDTLLRNTVEEYPPQRDMQLIALLVRHGASVNFDNGKCIKSAVSRGELDILNLLLTGRPSVETVSQSMTLAIRIEDRVRRTEIIRVLAACGASGESQVGEALLISVQESPVDIRMLETLLRQGKADANHNQGEALCYAVEHCELPVLDAILQYGLPNPGVIGEAITRAVMLSTAHTNREAKMLRLLEKEKTQGSIDDALVIELQAMSAIPEDERSLVVLQNLLNAKADPNTQSGKPLCLAVEMKDVKIVDIVMQKPLNSTSLVKSFALAMAVKLPLRRLSICRKLLAKNIPEEVISEELIPAVQQSDLQLCELFISHGASADYQSGKSMEQASGAEDIRILQLLLRTKPSKASLTASFVALSNEKNRKIRLEKLELLLKAGLKGETVDDAAIRTMKMNVPDIEVLAILVQYDVSVNHKDGEAMALAISSANIEALRLLLNKNISESTFRRAFRESWALDRRDRLEIITMLFGAGMPTTDQVNDALLEAVQDNANDSADRAIIKVLLANRASILHKNAQCLFDASQSLDFETISLLYTVPEACSVVTEVFQKLMATSEVWQSDAGFRIADMLLSHGVKAEARGQMLVTSIDKLATKTPGLASSFLDMLLRYRADVNYGRGLALQQAALYGNQEVVTKLFAKNPSKDALSMAFPYIFLSNQDENTVLLLVEAFITQANLGAQIDVNYDHPDLGQVLFLALDNFAGNLNILRTLIAVGCYADQRKDFKISEECGEESVTALCWVLCQPSQQINSSITGFLLEAGADPNLMTTKSWTTPLLLAAALGRQDIVQQLLQVGARADVEDHLKYSPLAFASRVGDINMMSAFIQSGTRNNDGSLHDAARELHHDAIQLLLENKHDLNFRSERHDGRTVLGELCYKSTDSGTASPVQERALELTIELLVGFGADFRIKFGSKSVLHLALDCSNPLQITRALLKTIMYNFINEDFNLYTDTSGIVYSPTMYVLKSQFEGPRDQQQQLWALLTHYGGHEIYYASGLGVTQPDGWTGAPPDVKAEEDRKKRREIRIIEEREELAIQLENERLRAAQTEAVKKASHDLDISHATSRARTAMQLAAEADSQREMAAQRQRKGELDHQYAITAAEVNREAELGSKRLEYQSREQRLQIDYLSERAAKEQAALNARQGAERQHRAEMNRIDEAAASRRYEMAARGARLLNAAAARAESAPQRMLTYSVEEAD